MSDRSKVRQTSVCRITPPNAVGDKLKLVGHQTNNFPEGAGMLEAEATADMLLMTQPFKAPSVSAPEIVEEPVAAQLVKAVLAAQRERVSALYEMYSPIVHGILLARGPRRAAPALPKSSVI